MKILKNIIIVFLLLYLIGGTFFAYLSARSQKTFRVIDEITLTILWIPLMIGQAINKSH